MFWRRLEDVLKTFWRRMTNDSGKDVFSVSFTKFLRTSFDKTPPGDCSLYLSENFDKFFRTPIL